MIKKKTTALLAAFALLGNVGFAQEPDLLWANGFGNSGYDLGKSICTDSDGNIIVTGGFRETIDFDPGDGEVNFSSNLDSEDIYLIKYDPNGAVIWAHALGSYNHERGESVTTDSDGNIYLTGRFFGTVDFDPGDGVTELTAIGGSSDVFIMKMNSDGDFQWVKSFGSSFTNQGLDICVAPSGSIYGTGSFVGTVDFDPGPGTYELSSVAGAPSSIYVIKLDNSGNFEWAGACGGDSGNTFGFGIAVDASENVYTVGSFGGSGDFDPTAGTEVLTTHGYDDIFIQKLDSDGGFEWAINLGSGYGEWADEITIDSDNNLIITGYFRLTVDFDPGPGVAELTTGASDMFILKMNAGGEYIWAGMSGGAATDSRGMALTTDADNNIYVTGKYNGVVDFDPGAGTAEMTSNSSQDIFVLKLNAAGEYQWSKSMGSAAEEFGGAEIAVDGSNIYVTGGFTETCDFNPGGAAYEITSAGVGDIFIMKLGECNVDNNVSQDGLTLTAAQDGATYQWLNCNDGYAPIDGETDQNIEVTMDGSYAVEVTLGACVDTSECLVVSGIGFEELNKDHIVVYPNPVEDVIYIQSDAIIENVIVYDLYGRVITSGNSTTISAAELETGVYLLTVETASGSKTMRFVKN